MPERSPFKELDEMFSADQRNECIVIVDKETGVQRPFTIIDLHKSLAGLPELEQAPEIVRNYYNMAKNMCLYGWFTYDLGMAAMHYMMICFETALREKFRVREGSETKKTLDGLLNWAIKKELIWDGGFSHLFFEKDRDEWESLPEKRRPVILDDPMGQKHCNTAFKQFVLHFRNSQSHGTSTLIPPYQVAGHMRSIAEAVFMLWGPNERTA